MECIPETALVFQVTFPSMDGYAIVVLPYLEILLP
jgi:hypothetical protein